MPTRTDAVQTLPEGGVARGCRRAGEFGCFLFVSSEKIERILFAEKCEGEFNDRMLERKTSRDPLSVSEGWRSSGMCCTVIH